MIYLDSKQPSKKVIYNKTQLYIIDKNIAEQIIYNNKSVNNILEGNNDEIIKPYKQECFKCQKIKPLNEFYEMSARKTGYSRDCKECINADNKAKRAAEGKPERKRYELQDGVKTCSKCQVTKPKKEFSYSVNSKDNLQSYCKSCINEYTKNR
jgi:hypothetical protein